MILRHKATGLQVLKYDIVKDKQGNEATVMGFNERGINVWLQPSHVNVWSQAQSFDYDVYDTELVQP